MATKAAPDRSELSPSELLHPGAELDLPGPGAARLAVNMEVGFGDGVGIEVVVGAAAGRADGAIDDEMRDVDVLGRELARHALGQPAKRKLAHREGRRIGVALDAGRGAGEEDAAAAGGQHLA